MTLPNRNPHWKAPMYGQLVILCILGELAMSIARVSEILVTKLVEAQSIIYSHLVKVLLQLWWCIGHDKTRPLTSLWTPYYMLVPRECMCSLETACPSRRWLLEPSQVRLKARKTHWCSLQFWSDRMPDPGWSRLASVAVWNLQRLFLKIYIYIISLGKIPVTDLATRSRNVSVKELATIIKCTDLL